MTRPLLQRVATSSHCLRGFHASVRRPKDQPGSSSPSISLKEAMTRGSAQRQPRRERNAHAAAQIGNLQFRRPPQGAGQGAQTASPKVITPRKPLIKKEPTQATGTMVRAPSTLRITRGAGPPARQPRGGPNLRARSGGPPGAGGARGGPKNRGSEAGPKRRERGDGGSSEDVPKVDDDILDAGAIPGSMMQTLYRMQRNQWDRKPYTPKYAQGSLEANELIHLGRELFKGESPPVKIWGKLEKTIGVVGMHGADAKLKVRRVPDGDAMPFGKEHENLLDLQRTGTAEQKGQGVAA